MMIQTEKVEKYFGALHALKSVSFEIKRGEIVGFLGQNGAGKTTLMRILTTYLPATAGRILIDGEDIAECSLSVRAKMGYLPETPPLYPEMSVREFLRFAAHMKNVPVKNIRHQVEKVISDCQLADAQNKMIGILSKGYRQRVGLAQAILNDPPVLILDEPTIGLDPTQIQHVRRLIKNLESEQTVILSTHILSEIEQIVKRVIIIRQGEIILDNTLERLLCNGVDGKRVEIIVKGTTPMFTTLLKKLNGLMNFQAKIDKDRLIIQVMKTSQLSTFNKLLKAILQEDGEIAEIREQKRNLEDIFLELNETEELSKSS